MDYAKVNVPFLGNAKIKNRAESFRKRLWDSSIPVDIEKIIELKLKFNIIPSPGLEKFCDVDALIASDWQDIYVDYDRYLDERYDNRLRFSLAHEIGHFVLHKEIWSSFRIRNFRDYYKLIKDISPETYYRLEIQARKFAGFLLVPPEVLIKEKDKILRKVESGAVLKKIEKNKLNSYIAIPLSKIFAVSEDVVKIALSELGGKT